MAEPIDPWTRLLDHFRTVDATLTEAAYWKDDAIVVGVIDDQGDRTDFAWYVCAMTREFGIPRAHVRIVDFERLILDQEETILAETTCPNSL